MLDFRGRLIQRIDIYTGIYGSYLKPLLDSYVKPVLALKVTTRIFMDGYSVEWSEFHT